MRIKHIQIITRNPNDLSNRSILGHWARHWEESGIRVAIGPCSRLQADIGIMHVDATHVPEALIPDNPEGLPLLNALVLDISKRRVSSQLLDVSSICAGPVIVKTDANFFGSIEAKDLPLWSIRKWRRKLAKQLDWKMVHELPRNSYPILESIAEVPGWVWKRSDLVVERFLPEMENGLYVLRSWLFFGDQDYVVKLYGPHPIVKAGNIRRHEVLEGVPESLRQARHDMKIDYGKFDYVVTNGEVVLLDVNKTPSAAIEAPGPRIMRLADGLFSYGGTSK